MAHLEVKPKSRSLWWLWLLIAIIIIAAAIYYFAVYKNHSTAFIDSSAILMKAALLPMSAGAIKRIDHFKL